MKLYVLLSINSEVTRNGHKFEFIYIFKTGTDTENINEFIYFEAIIDFQ